MNNSNMFNVHKNKIKKSNSYNNLYDVCNKENISKNQINKIKKSNSFVNLKILELQNLELKNYVHQFLNSSL